MLELRQVADDQVDERLGQLVGRMTARRTRTHFEEPEQARAWAEDVVRRNAAALRHYDVADGEAVVGAAVWWARGDQAELYDLVLEDPSRAGELLPALLELGRADQARSVGVAAVPGEPARARLVELAEFVPRATNMALRLDGDLGDPGELELRTMTQEEFDRYLEGSVESYVAELAAAGMSPESAREQGERQMAELIPSGLDSPGQHFFTAWVGDSPVGTLWISTEHPMAFVYDIAVEESQRRRGYGEAIMNAGARWCRDRGHPALGLNVFAHNPGARALYDKLGYQVTADYRTVDIPRAN